MKKLGIAIKSTLMGSGEPFKINAGSWDSKVVDIRDVLRHVPSLASNPKRDIIFLSYGEEGAYITIARTYPNRPGDNVAGWIFVPAEILFTDEDAVRVIEEVRRIIYMSELPDRRQLEQVFGTAYPLKPAPMRYKPSPKNGHFAKRDVTPATPLGKILGSAIYQPYYANYQVVFVEQYPGEIAGAEDLTNRQLTALIAALPPAAPGVRFFFAANNEPFSTPVMVPQGSIMELKAVRNGYEPLSIKGRAERDGAELVIPRLNWQKKISESDFNITSSSGARVYSGVKIFINGQLLNGQRYMLDSELERARVTAQYNGREKTMSVNLNNLPVNISFEGETAGGVVASASGMGSQHTKAASSATEVTWKAETPDEKLINVTVSGRNVRRSVSPLKGYKVEDKYLVYVGGNVWVNRIQGFCAALLLGAIVCGILAICGTFDSKPKVEEKEQPTNVESEYKDAEREEIPQETAVPLDKVEAESQSKSEVKSDPAAAADYLDNHPKWNRAEMEQYVELQGLFDDLSLFQVEDLDKRYSAVYEKSSRLKDLKQHYDEGVKYHDPAKGTSTGVGVDDITYRVYINNLNPGRGNVKEKTSTPTAKQSDAAKKESRSTGSTTTNKNTSNSSSTTKKPTQTTPSNTQTQTKGKRGEL